MQEKTDQVWNLSKDRYKLSEGGYKLSRMWIKLDAYLQSCNWTTDNNLGLNLYVVPTTCHIVIIPDGVGVWEYAREEAVWLSD